MNALAELIDNGRVWRGRELARLRAEPTGFAELDARLPGGGWPVGSLSEILYARPGVGELSLALPLAARLTQADRWVVLVAPPHVPYAPALAHAGLKLSRVLVVDAKPASAQALWAAEQLLRAGGAAVLLWSNPAQSQPLRRLQLAAEAGGGIGLLYRPAAGARPAVPAAEFSPTTLRLHVWRENGIPQVEILKCRGASSGAHRCAFAVAQ